MGMKKLHQTKRARQVLPTSMKTLPGKPDQRPRLLLVEDDAMIAIGEQRMLEGYGYQVVVAETGELALEICSSGQEIDLVLMDIKLGAGSLSGPETAVQILKARHLPVIFLSCHAGPEIVAQTENIPAYGYVVKSSDGTMLDASIKMALRLFQAEKRLLAEARESAFLKNIFERSSQPFGVAYPDGKFGLVNGAFERLTGYTAAELKAISWGRTLTPPEWHEVEREKLDELHRTLEPVRYEKEYLRKDGSLVPVELLVHLSADPEGRPEYYYSFVTDLTDHTQAKEKIKTLLDEKVRLLDEAHHRIKNVLHSINNLLTLQASAATSADGRVTLLEAANRVQSMMLLYDKLQQSADHLSVSGQSYLSSLADAIVESFTGTVPVTLEKSIQDCPLGATICQPLGLILNELLTNIMRHAFVGKASGKAVVTFQVDETRGVLSVHDDGRGLPDSIDFNNQSPTLGMRLVSLLSNQIGGTVRTERVHGTKVIVEFPSSGIHEARR